MEKRDRKLMCTNILGVKVCNNSLDRSSDKLPEVPRDDPEGQILAPGLGGRKGHDGPRLCDVPRPRANAVAECPQDKILDPHMSACCPRLHQLQGGGSFHTNPLVPELAVAVVRGALDRKRHGANDQGPFHTDLVHDGAAEETNCRAMLVNINDMRNTIGQGRKLGCLPSASMLYLIAVLKDPKTPLASQNPNGAIFTGVRSTDVRDVGGLRRRETTATEACEGWVVSLQIRAGSPGFYSP